MCHNEFQKVVSVRRRGYFSDSIKICIIGMQRIPANCKTSVKRYLYQVFPLFSSDCGTWIKIFFTKSSVARFWTARIQIAVFETQWMHGKFLNFPEVRCVIYSLFFFHSGTINCKSFKKSFATFFLLVKIRSMCRMQRLPANFGKFLQQHVC